MYYVTYVVNLTYRPYFEMLRILLCVCVLSWCPKCMFEPALLKTLAIHIHNFFKEFADTVEISKLLQCTFLSHTSGLCGCLRYAM